MILQLWNFLHFHSFNHYLDLKSKTWIIIDKDNFSFSLIQLLNFIYQTKYY